MKLNIFFLFLVINVFSTKSIAQNHEFLSKQEILIKKMILSEHIKPAISNGKIMILKSEYCTKHDCSTFLKDYKEKIQLCTKSDLFQRGLSIYLEIKSFNQKEGVLIVKIINQREKEKSKRVEIAL
jgi:hypothetical protein